MVCRLLCGGKAGARCWVFLIIFFFLFLCSDPGTTLIYSLSLYGALPILEERNSYLVCTPLKDVRLKKNILICAIIRKREIIIPDGSAVIELGDSVVIVSKEHHFSGLKSILD